MNVSETFSNYANHVNLAYATGSESMGLHAWESHAEGMYVWDASGKIYLDCLAGYGVMNLGHRHPHVVQAVKAQLDKMPLTTKELLNPLAATLGKMLADRLPGDLSYSFFCNSGTEATEGALKLARWHTGRPGIISTHGSFHGKTLGSLSVTSREIFRTPVEPLLPDVTFVPYGDASAIEKAITPSTGAVILEPVQGEGGVNVPPKGYLKQVSDICKARNVIFILDECQTGMGRTGALFAAEREGVVPDIITGGKAFGGGVIPAAFFAGTPEVWTKLNEFPTFHTSTFGGGELACAAAIAALETTETENLTHNAVERGAEFKAGFIKLIEDFPHRLKQVRGEGLLLAVEFHDAMFATTTYNKLFEYGVLVGFLLRNPTVMRIEPPLIINSDQVQQALSIFRDIFENAEG